MDDVAESRASTGARRLVLAAGAAACLAVGLAACTSTGPAPLPSTASSAPTVTATPVSATPTAALVQAVFSRLPVAARSAPAFTWDSAGRRGQGAAADGDTVLLLAAACDGGGELTITVGRKDTVLDCAQSAATGPIDVTASIATDAPTGVEVDVRVTAGHPRYLAKAVSLPVAEATPSAS